MDAMLQGVANAFSLTNLTFCFLGVFLGTAMGVLPGIGALAAVSLLLPITYHLDPTTAIIMLAGVYYGAAYGGSTASILLNLPGTPSNAVTCLHAHAMATQGRARLALFTAAISAFLAAPRGTLLLPLLTPSINPSELAIG